MLNDKARTFAIEAHGDQKYGDSPYVTHLDQVWDVLQHHGFTEQYFYDIAYLHDVLEDTQNEYENIAASFGTEVADAVVFCTDEQGMNRRERKAKTYARCRQEIDAWEAKLPRVMDAPWHGMIVKVADRVANLLNCHKTNSSLLGMYRKERETFRAALYTPGVCEEMWQQYEDLLA